MEQALYRKYRPQTFKEIEGQEHIVSVLEAAIRKGVTTHAYLFFGSRGTGKTSVARIFAREIGCMPEDIYEIDAASTGGVNDIRELREGVKTLPFRSPHKAYIIDEVHMLSKDAFNAFLKTLEEPPKHAVFILATTEVHKVPETVVSRCQTFTFKKPPRALLKKSALRIAKEEGYTLDPGAADLVALLGDGSFRDTHGILHLVLSAAEEKTIPRALVEKVTHAPPAVLVHELMAAISAKDLPQALSVVSRASASSIDFSLFLKLLLEKMRLALLLRFDLETKRLVKEEFSEDDAAFLLGVSEEGRGAITSETLTKLLSAYTDTRGAYIKELPLELALVDLLGEKQEKPGA